jgi:hypothetical protein
MSAESSSSGTDLYPLSDDFTFEPDGLEFNVPVAISMTLADTAAAGRVPAILHTGSEGPGILLQTQVDGLELEATLDHFSSASAVAPTAPQLELFWDSILLEIDTYGVTVERVRALAGIYLHAQAGGTAYASIDLAAWSLELWAQTNDLIVLGNLQCTGGDYVAAEFTLNAAVNIAGLMLFTDLEAEALQAIADCSGISTGVEASLVLGTASGWVRAVYDDYTNPLEDWIWPTIGDSTHPTAECEYDGGHSSLDGSFSVSAGASVENQAAGLTMTLLPSPSGFSLAMEASATAAPAMAPSTAVEGKAQLQFDIDPDQAVLIIENSTTSAVDLDIVWAAIAGTGFTGDAGNGSASISYSFSIDGSAVGSGHAWSDPGGDHQSGTFGGSETISVEPGRHCLNISASMDADVDIMWNDMETPSSGSAALSLTVSVTVP